MKLLSVIIPIYNVEPFVEKCLRSLEAQDISRNDYEIICVNDGSPDNSREVVLRLKEEFNNIILVDQENHGLCVARNTGFEKADGKYLLIIDPDDYVQENSFGRILQEADFNNAQMVFPGYTYLDPNSNVQGKKIFKKYQGMVLAGMQAYYILREDEEKVEGPTEGIIYDSISGVLLEAEFVKKNSLGFVSGIILNGDVEFMARAHCIADRCIIMNYMFYIVFARIGSATRSNQFDTEKVRNGFILAAKNLKNFQEAQSLTERQKIFLNGPITKFVLLSTYSGIKTRSIKELKRTVSILKTSGLEKLRLEDCSRFNLICGKFYNFSPYLGPLILFVYVKVARQYRLFFSKR